MQQLVMLGTGAATPTLRRNVSSFALKLTSGATWMFDCGEGTQIQIAKSDDVKLGKLSAVFITHLHGDHSFGLPGLLASMSLLAGSETRQVLCIGPKGIETFVKTSLDLSATYITYNLKFIELTPNESTDLGIMDGVHVWAHPLQHKVPCFGFVVQEADKPGQLDAKAAASKGAKGAELGRLKAGQDVTLANGTVLRASDFLSAPVAGRRAVLLGDTANSDTCLATGMNCHLLVHECTYDASLEQKAVAGGHSTSAMAGKFAKTIQAKRIILTHFSQRYDKTEKNTDGPDVDQLVSECAAECGSSGCVVIAAQDLAVYDI